MSKPQINRADVTAAFNPKGKRTVRATVVEAGGVDLKYLVNNIKLLADYEIKNVIESIKRADINKRTGLYVSERGEVSALKLTVNLDDPIEKLLKQIEDKKSGDFGDIDFDAYSKLRGIVKEYYMRHKSGNSYTISGDYWLSALLVFLKYIISGKADPSYVKVNEIKKKEGWDNYGGFMGTKAFQIEFMGAKIKAFKNGRVDIKMPKSSQAQHMQQTLEQWGKKAWGR